MARIRRRRGERLPRREAKALLARPDRIVRAIAICLAAAIAIWVVVASSAANVFQLRYPVRALTVDSAHAGASANLAQQLFLADYFEEAERFAAASLRRTPISVPALRTLGLVAEARGSEARALALFRLAHAMSRRDRAAEAWLMQNALRNSNFAEAIRHFDITMRVARRGEEQLIPLLVAGTADPRVVAPLRRQLAQHPQWKVPFLLQLASLGPNADHVAILSRRLLDPGKPEEQVALRHLISQLADRRRYDLAWSFYREARRGTPAQPPAALNAGDFWQRDYPPFEWWLADEPDLTALVDPRPDGRRGDALSLIGREGRGGEVARRLVRLRPGRHVIALDTGSVPAEAVERPEVSFGCVGTNTSLFTLRLPASGNRTGRVRQPFAVPPGCNWQWVRIRLAGRQASDSDPWIANLSINAAR